MSNNLTWTTFLHGNKLAGKDNIIGLLPKLSQRVGMLTRLSKYLSRKQFKAGCDGLFTSCLLYCLPLYSNVWGIATMDDTHRRSHSFSKGDCRKLQVMQNKILRLKCGIANRNIPTNDLLDATGDMSVHQLGANQTLGTVFRILRSGKPEYLADKLKMKTPLEDNIFPSRHMFNIQIQYNLSVSKSRFLYRGSRLWNMLQMVLKTETRIKTFKQEVKKWILGRISRRPPG